MKSLKNRARVSRGVRVAVWIAMAALAASGCKSKSPTDGMASSASSDTLLIGEVGSMTGSEATFGISTHNGIEMAIKEINAKGGILAGPAKGKKLAVKALDDQGKPDEAATAVRKLITQDKVIAILGEVASSRSLAMAPIAQEYKVPMITPSSTNPGVTEQGDYIFRVCFIDPFQGTVMAKFAHETLKATKVAILRDVKNDYSVGLSNYFAETFKKLGGSIVVDQSYSAGDMDFKSQLTAIRGKKPDAVFVPGYYTEVGLIARQAKELGLTVPLMGGDGWDSPKLTEIGGKAMDGHYFSNHYAADSKDPRIIEFVKNYKSAYREVPDSLAAMGYDAVLVLVGALERAKALDSASLRAALADTKNFPTVTGVITLDSKRNPVKPAAVLQVQKGQFVFQSTVNP